MFHFFHKNKDYITNCELCHSDVGYRLGTKLHRCGNCRKKLLCIKCLKKNKLCKDCNKDYQEFCNKLSNLNVKNNMEYSLLE